MSYNNPIPCKWCSEPIFFSEDYVSPNNKKIPMSADSETPHVCLEKPRNGSYDPPAESLADRMDKLEKRVAILERNNK